eukprot:43671-Chlamydomonas_euryale.AAC.1
MACAPRSTAARVGRGAGRDDVHLFAVGERANAASMVFMRLMNWMACIPRSASAGETREGWETAMF